jgi:hypothetical protein
VLADVGAATVPGMISSVRRAALVSALLIAVTGCSSPTGPTGTPQPSVSTVYVTVPPSAAGSTPVATATPSVESTSPVLPDGRSPVYITSIDVANRALTFDLIIFLTGQDAKDEWKKEGHTGEGPPNDYLIVNNNPKLRTLPVSSSASITYNDPNNSFAPTAVSLSNLKGPFQYRPFWITVTGGVITKIEEQFIP